MIFFKISFLFLVFIFCQCLGQNYKTDSLKFIELKKPFISKMRDLQEKSGKLHNLKKNSDILTNIKIKKKIDSIDILWSDDYKNLILAELYYFQKKPNFKDAITAMLFSITKKEAENFYPLYLETFEKLNLKIKSSDEGLKFKIRSANLLNAQSSKQAPQFVLKEINNEIFNLKENKGNVILIDFWASWCEPCLKDLPVLKAELEKYKNDGFKIVSISKDANLESWKKSIKKNGMQNFVNISTLENQLDILDLYVITGIPVKFLIDRNGVIVKKWRGGSDEILIEIQKELAKLFLLN